MTISFSFSPCLHIVKIRIALIQDNFLSHSFKLFIYAKKCSVLIGCHRISFSHLLKWVPSSTTKGKRFCDKKSWKYATKEKRTWRIHENWLAAKAESAQWTQGPAKKYIWEHHFSNHRNVWKVKTSWLDRVQGIQKRETANHTQNWGLHSSRTQKCFDKIDLV